MYTITHSCNLSAHAALEVLCSKKHAKKHKLIVDDSTDNEKINKLQPSTSQITREWADKKDKSDSHCHHHHHHHLTLQIKTLVKLMVITIPHNQRAEARILKKLDYVCKALAVSQAVMVVVAVVMKQLSIKFFFICSLSCFHALSILLMVEVCPLLHHH